MRNFKLNMKIKINKKIGNSTIQFEIEEPKDVEALALAGMIASAPSQCSLCKSQNVTLSGKKAKGYTFVEIKCEDCSASSSMGQYKEGGIFWKSFEKFQPQPKAEGDDNIPVIEENE